MHEDNNYRWQKTHFCNMEAESNLRQHELSTEIRDYIESAGDQKGRRALCESTGTYLLMAVIYLLGRAPTTHSLELFSQDSLAQLIHREPIDQFGPRLLGL
jgi:hypothetical protein